MFRKRFLGLRVQFPSNQFDVVSVILSSRVVCSPDGFASCWTVSKKDFNVLFRTKSLFHRMLLLASLSTSLLKSGRDAESERKKDTKRWSKIHGAKYTLAWCVKNIIKYHELRIDFTLFHNILILKYRMRASTENYSDCMQLLWCLTVSFLNLLVYSIDNEK